MSHTGTLSVFFRTGFTKGYVMGFADFQRWEITQNDIELRDIPWLLNSAAVAGTWKIELRSIALK